VGTAAADEVETPERRFDAESFLLGSQLANGAWADRGSGVTADDEVSATAAVLLTYLGSGETDRAGGRQAQVRRGLDYVLAQVGRDGALRGVTTTRAEALALWVLSEAAAATGAPRYAEAAGRVAAHLAWLRLSSGLWPATRTGAGDAEATAWAALALASARSAGVPVNGDVISGAATALRAQPGASLAARALVDSLAAPRAPAPYAQVARDKTPTLDAALFVTLAARRSGTDSDGPLPSAQRSLRVDRPVGSAAYAVLALAASGGHWTVLRGSSR